MFLITLKQPFAELVCLGVMDVIPTSFNPKFIGKLFIHASNNDKKYTPTDEQFALLEEIDEFNFHNNAIIGQVHVKEIVTDSKSIWAKGKYQMIFENPILFDKPILNVKGKPLIWHKKDCDND